MSTTFSSLADVQLARLLATPGKFADNPFRSIALGGLQQRNAMLDGLFYDVKVVRESERAGLAFWLAREGAVLVVPPSDGPDLTIHLDGDAFLDADAEKVGALAVAGVGSSALGSAALARNVADAIGKPVAAVVSGYGLADVLTEAMGGWLWFGALNSSRHLFEGLDRFTKLFTASEQAMVGRTGGLPISKDTETVIRLLGDPRFAGDLLVGHSKGNLVISEALYAMAERSEAEADSLAQRYRIVTIGAKVGMPPGFRRVLDIMGAWDSFGALNSRGDIAADYVVPHAWHSTNTDFLGDWGLDVTEALRTVLPDFDSWLTPNGGADPRVRDWPQLATARLTDA